MTKKIDWTKPIQTPEGLKARYVDGNYKSGYYHESYKYIVIVTEAAGVELIRALNDLGEDSFGKPQIINVPEREFILCIKNADCTDTVVRCKESELPIWLNKYAPRFVFDSKDALDISKLRAEMGGKR